MKKIKIAVISDLHCRHERETPRSTYLYSDLPRIPTAKHPVQALKATIEKEQLMCDYIICPGDISDKIDIQGLISGYGFIEELKQDLKAFKLLCVPGNHDVDSRKKHSLESPFQVLKTHILNYPITETELVEKFWANNYSIYKDENLEILILNSVFNHFDPAESQKSIIPENVLEKIEDDLKASGNKDGILRIAVGHHHPIKISNIDSIKYKDGDSLENGDVLLNLLKKYNYHIFIHGHKHIPQLFINNNFPIFCSGSFSSLENIIESPYKNTFHIIEFSLDDSTCKGRIDTWSYTSGKGWAKSKDPEEAFPSLTGFGLNINIESFASEINSWFSLQGKDRIHYSDFLIRFPDMPFLAPFQQIELSEKLYTKYQIEFNPGLTIGVKEVSKLLN